MVNFTFWCNLWEKSVAAGLSVILLFQMVIIFILLIPTPLSCIARYNTLKKKGKKDSTFLLFSCGFLLENLTHLPWCRIYLSVNWISIGSGNGLSPIRRQAITWTNAHLLSIGPWGTNCSEILSKYKTFHWKKCLWKCRLRNGGHFL